MEKLIVKWQVGDGYAGKERQQTTEINIEDYMDEDEWNELSQDQKMENIDSFVQEDFDQKISFEIDDWGI